MSVERRQTEALRRVLETDRLAVHTAIPGVVRSYDASTQTAEITLGLREVAPAGDDDDSDSVSDYPILPSVPVAFPSGGGYALHFPLAAGDPGLVVFAEGDISRWLETGEPSDPGVSTRHGLSGGVFFPGLRHVRRRSSDADSAVLRLGRESGGPALSVGVSVVSTNAPIEANGSSESAALASKVWAELVLIQAAIAVAGGSYTAPASLTLIGSTNLKTGG